MTMQEEYMEQIEHVKAEQKGMVRMALYRLRTATKADIFSETNLSQGVIAEILKEGIEKGDLIEKGTQTTGVGRKAITYSLNVEHANLVVVIAEGTQMEYVVTDIEGQVNDRRKIMIGKQDSYFDKIIEMLTEAIAHHPKIAAIAVGVPGAVTPQGIVFAVPQIAEWEDVNLRRKIEEVFHLPVLIKNDINTTAMGYYRKGLAFTLEELVYIHIGGGLGGAVVIDGKIVNGFTNFAGEIAFMQVGEKRSIEELILNPRRRKTKMQMLAKMIVNIICVINPSVIVIGGVTEEEDILPDKIRSACSKMLPENMLPLIRKIEDERKFYFDGLIGMAAEKYLKGNIE